MSVLVVHILADGGRRFSELRREIPGVSQPMLTLTLRNLERDGLVRRTVTPSVFELMHRSCQEIEGLQFDRARPRPSRR